jgi:hypothetical protein
MTGPATGMPPCGWPSAATWTWPGRYCARPPTPATGRRPRQLGNLLAKRGDLDALRARAAAGLGFAGGYLPGLLTKQGRAEEAERLERSGLNPEPRWVNSWRVIDACSGPFTVLQRRGRLRCSAISDVPVPLSLQPAEVIRGNGTLSLVSRVAVPADTVCVDAGSSRAD